VEFVLTGVKSPAVPLDHVLQADGAVVISVILSPPLLPVSLHEPPHPLIDRLDAHPTQLSIVLPPQHVYVSLSVRSVQLRVATLQLGKQLLIRLGLAFSCWS